MPLYPGGRVDECFGLSCRGASNDALDDSAAEIDVAQEFAGRTVIVVVGHVLARRDFPDGVERARPILAQQ